MNEIKITKANFENEVIKSDKPVLLDFWASWCGPCRMTAPELQAFAEEHPEIKVGKVNIDEEGELASAFNVTSIPTFFLISEGKIVKKLTGAMSKHQMVQKFTALE